MAAYRQVYGFGRLRADCQDRDQLQKYGIAPDEYGTYLYRHNAINDKLCAW